MIGCQLLVSICVLALLSEFQWQSYPVHHILHLATQSLLTLAASRWDMLDESRLSSARRNLNKRTEYQYWVEQYNLLCTTVLTFVYFLSRVLSGPHHNITSPSISLLARVVFPLASFLLLRTFCRPCTEYSVFSFRFQSTVLQSACRTIIYLQSERAAQTLGLQERVFTYLDERRTQDAQEQIEL